MSLRPALMLASLLASAFLMVAFTPAQDAATAPQGSSAGAVHPRFPIAVLYAGRPDDPTHTADWTAFLTEWFVRVGTADYSKFTPKDADDYDVVIFDARTRPTPGHIGLPKAAKLPADFNRASLCVSGAGTMVVEGLKLKLDWL